MALSAPNGSLSSSSSSSFPPWKYHVFLSFRGEDTRRGFTDHLYAALQRQEMITFRDDEELERGELISQALIKAIEDSLSAIVILSQNYPFSTWCLDELQKIIESKKTLGRDVFPIFYGVDPFEVRYQIGRFGEAFKKHEKRHRKDKEKVQRWRDALEEIAGLSGWNTKNQSEAKIIEEIIEFVWTKLSPKLQSYNDDFVGIDSMIEKIDLLSNRASQDVRFIGIWGMGGTGKTTLARVIYERFRANFQINCFLHNVTELYKRSGLVHLQQTFLSHCKLGKLHVINDICEGKNILSSILRNRRVILVLDDLSDRSHIENLAGNGAWFGQGSTVIITTREFDLLKAQGIHETHEIKCLNTTESLKFFSQKTFGSDQPEERYLELSKMAVQYSGGLPLALSVLGSFLSGINLSEWKEALDGMKDAPRDDILKTLKISYDRLEDEEKNIFLDIACFFNGKKKDDVTKILKNCGLNATIGIKVLIEKSLVTSNGWTLEMHDLLQKMGRKIVYQESPNDIGRRSRLWSIEDIDQVLGDKRGTRFIQGIVLESSPQSYEANAKVKAFSNMCNLKLLMISNVQILCGLTYLPNSLKVLAWNGYPLGALPLGEQAELVDLKMHHSKIIRPWNETQIFRKLKSIDLSHSNGLTQTPIVSGVPRLEQLILEGCTDLVEVHQSVGKHKNLVELNMKNCINLKIFPSKLKMGSLKDFILSGCSKVVKLPEFGENMKSLVMLDLKDCKNLLCLPSSIRNLESLETLNISGCSKFSRQPNSVDEDQLLENLLVSETAERDIISFNPVPMDRIFTSLSHLPLLKELDLSYCNLSDGSIPYDLSGFSSLWSLSLEGNNFSYLPDNFVANLSKLRFLKLSDCTRLRKLPVVPQALHDLTAKGCPSLEPVSDPLQLWNFLALDNNKMESSDLPRSTITGNEIPPWFEYQNYVSLDRKFENMDFDSIISIKVNIPRHYRLSEWWRIDLCLVLEYVTSNPLEETQASISWTVLATEPCFPAHRGAVNIITHQLLTPHLYITSLRGLQEQLRGDSNQLEIRIFSRTYLKHDKMKISKCGCHVYCKDDVDTALQPQLQMSKDHIMDNERENVYSSPSVRETRRFIENPSTSKNSSSPNALRISNPIHPTTNHQDLHKFSMRSEDVIYPSSSMHSSSISETSKLIRFVNKTCICERRASLKVSHDGKSYYVCEDNKCNYVELSCPEDSVFTGNCQSFEASHEHKISLLTNIILSLCSCISYFSSCFSGSRYSV